MYTFVKERLLKNKLLKYSYGWTSPLCSVHQCMHISMCSSHFDNYDSFLQPIATGNLKTADIQTCNVRLSKQSQYN